MSKTIDLIQPFQLEVPQLRGRLVRLGPALDALLARHNYPAPVATLLAETVTLTALLAGMLKYEGVFTLQAKSSGPITMLVADVTSEGCIRAYAQYDATAEMLANPNPELPLTAGELLGDGYIAFTVDMGPDTERHQGIVELAGDTMADFVQHYFRLSEQIDTGFEIAATFDKVHGWRAGGVMLQRLPELAKPAKVDEEDGWRRCMILLDSVTIPELTDPVLPPPDLLYRLFNQEEVRVFETSTLFDGCRCSRERVQGMLRALSDEDMVAMKAEGGTSVTCEFCSRVYSFNLSDLNDMTTNPAS